MTYAFNEINILKWVINILHSCYFKVSYSHGRIQGGGARATPLDKNNIKKHIFLS